MKSFRLVLVLALAGVLAGRTAEAADAQQIRPPATCAELAAEIDAAYGLGMRLFAHLENAMTAFQEGAIASYATASFARMQALIALAQAKGCALR